MPDVKWIGGIQQAQKLAAMAEVYGAMVSPHNASGPVATAASVHLSFTLANFVLLEYPWGVPDWRGDLCRGTETLAGGYFAPPSAAGLGIDLDADLAAAHSEPPLGSFGAGVALPRH